MYFPQEILEKILLYTDNRLEVKQKRLWESIQSERITENEDSTLDKISIFTKNQIYTSFISKDDKWNYKKNIHLDGTTTLYWT